MAEYKAAVIGLGRMGSTFDDEMTRGGSLFLPYCHAPAYHYSPQTRLVAGADPHDEQRSLFGDKWGLTENHLYSDYRDMVENESPDIVSVCTTARVRPEIVKTLAKSGVKAIWAEKPIAFSLKEADEMVEICNKENVILAINCARRWNPLYSQARNIITAGHIGNILQINAIGECGLSHNGSHLIDTVRFLAGSDAKWVIGEMESDAAAASNEDIRGNGYLVFDNGARAFIRSMHNGGAPWSFEIIGEEGSIRTPNDAQSWELNSYSTSQFPPESNTKKKSGRYPVSHQFPWPIHLQGMGLTIVEDIITSINNSNPPKCSGKDGLKALEIALALRESHRNGFSKIDLPLKDRTLKIESIETKNDQIPARVRKEMESKSG